MNLFAKEPQQDPETGCIRKRDSAGMWEGLVVFVLLNLPGPTKGKYMQGVTSPFPSRLSPPLPRHVPLVLSRIGSQALAQDYQKAFQFRRLAPQHKIGIPHAHFVVPFVF